MPDLSITDSQPLPAPQTASGALSIAKSEPLPGDSAGSRFGKGVGEGSGVTHAWENLKNLSGFTNFKGAYDAFKNGDHAEAAKQVLEGLKGPGMKLGEGVLATGKDQIEKAHKAFSEGRYTDALAHAGASVVQPMAPTADAIEQGRSGDVAGMLGTTVGNLGTLAIPGVGEEAAALARRGAKAVGRGAQAVVRAAGSPLAQDVLGVVSPRAAHAASLARRGMSLVDKIKGASTPPEAPAAPPPVTGSPTADASVVQRAPQFEEMPAAPPARPFISPGSEPAPAPVPQGPPQAGLATTPGPRAAAPWGEVPAQPVTPIDAQPKPVLPSSGGTPQAGEPQAPAASAQPGKVPAPYVQRAAFANQPVVESKGFELLGRSDKVKDLAKFLHEGGVSADDMGGAKSEHWKTAADGAGQARVAAGGQKMGMPSPTTQKAVLTEMQRLEKIRDAKAAMTPAAIGMGSSPAPAGEPKKATADHIQEYADQKGIDPAAARKEFEDSGYQVEDPADYSGVAQTRVGRKPIIFGPGPKGLQGETFANAPIEDFPSLMRAGINPLKGEGVIHVDPQRANRDSSIPSTVSHEDIHSVLASVPKDELKAIQASIPGSKFIGARLRTMGNVTDELPAYMGAYDGEKVSGVGKFARNSWVEEFQRKLAEKYPKQATDFGRLSKAR